MPGVTCGHFTLDSLSLVLTETAPSDTRRVGIAFLKPFPAPCGGNTSGRYPRVASAAMGACAPLLRHGQGRGVMERIARNGSAALQPGENRNHGTLGLTPLAPIR